LAPRSSVLPLSPLPSLLAYAIRLKAALSSAYAARQTHTTFHTFIIEVSSLKFNLRGFRNASPLARPITLMFYLSYRISLDLEKTFISTELELSSFTTVSLFCSCACSWFSS
jgi:hypothetical protein